MKKLIVFAAFVVAFSCAPKSDPSEDNLQKAQQMFEAFNRHDWKAMAEFYSDTAQFLDPSFGPDYVSKTRVETAAKYQEMQSMFPDIHDDVVGMYASGDKVTVEFVSTGTAPDSTTFKLPIVSVLTFTEGQIVRDATYYDNF